MLSICRYTNQNPLTTTLQSGQVLHLVEQNYNDISGTSITANHPVAVFSGHSHMATDFMGSRDMVVEQLPHTGTFGTRFAAVPFQSMDSHYYLIAVSDRALTKVKVEGREFLLHRAGDFTQPLSISNIRHNFVYVEADKPILLSQWVSGSANDKSSGPSVLIVPPLEQYLTDYSFMVPEHPDIGMMYESELHVIFPEGKGDLLMLDNMPLDTNFHPVKGSDLYGLRKAIRPGVHHIFSRDESTKFGIYLKSSDVMSCAIAYGAGRCHWIVSIPCIFMYSYYMMYIHINSV